MNFSNTEVDPLNQGSLKENAIQIPDLAIHRMTLQRLCFATDLIIWKKLTAAKTISCHLGVGNLLFCSHSGH